MDLQAALKAAEEMKSKAGESNDAIWWGGTSKDGAGQVIGGTIVKKFRYDTSYQTNILGVELEVPDAETHVLVGATHKVLSSELDKFNEGDSIVIKAKGQTEKGYYAYVVGAWPR